MALGRLEIDISHGRTFFLHPYELKLIARHRAQWIQSLTARIEAESWRPAQPYIANIPKGAGGVRPGALLLLEDQVVYSAIVGAALPALAAVLNRSPRQKDYAYLLRKPETEDWISAPVWCWREFHKRCLLALTDRVTAIVISDITACYEHIDHEILQSDLRAAGVDTPVLRLLASCLSKWSTVNGRGLPQNLTASHLLAKLYLSRVDQGMADRGHDHVRYVDDIRIFSRNLSDAKKALLDLAELLRGRGLSLQSAKTAILDQSKARTVFEGQMPRLRDLIKEYLEDIAEQIGIEPDYITVAEAERLIKDEEASIPSAMLCEAYQRYIVDNARFEKTLFHFLIRRLAKAGDTSVIEHCLSLLEPHPEETDDILRYIGSVSAVDSAEDKMLDYLTSFDAVYDYQRYQFLRWRLDRAEPASERLLAFARSVAHSPNTPDYVIAVARAMLGRHGTPADLDALMHAYGSAVADLERASIICAIAQMEKGLRNAFLGKVNQDGTLCAVAVAAVRANYSWHEA